MYFHGDNAGLGFNFQRPQDMNCPCEVCHCDKPPRRKKSRRHQYQALETFEPRTFQPCLHRYFKTEPVERDCLTSQQYVDMLATPKAHPWLEENKNSQLNGDKSSKKKRRRKYEEETAKQDFRCMDYSFAEEFINDMWDVMSPDVTDRLIDFLVSEFGMTVEEAEDFIDCKSSVGKPTPCVKKQSRAIISLGPKHKWVKKFTDVFSTRIEQYIVNMLMAKKSPRIKRLAERILNDMCEVTGDKTSIQYPKSKREKTMVLVATRLAFWFEDIMKDLDKPRKERPEISEAEESEEEEKPEEDERREKEEKEDRDKNVREEPHKKDEERPVEEETPEEAPTEKPVVKEEEPKEEQKPAEEETPDEEEKPAEEEVPEEEEKPAKEEIPSEEEKPAEEEKPSEEVKPAEEEKPDQVAAEPPTEVKEEPAEEKVPEEKPPEEVLPAEEGAAEEAPAEEVPAEEVPAEEEKPAEGVEEPEPEEGEVPAEGEEAEEGEKPEEEEKPQAEEAGEDKVSEEDKTEEKPETESVAEKMKKEPSPIPVSKKVSITKPLKPALPTFVVKPKTGSTLEVQKLSSGTMVEFAAQARGLPTPPRRRVPATSSPLNMNTAQEWKGWAENIADMASEWGHWIETKITDAEKQLKEKRDQREWKSMLGATQQEALKWIGEGEKIKEEGEKWDKKIEKPKGKPEEIVKTTDLS